jgi:hypothetical protein
MAPESRNQVLRVMWGSERGVPARALLAIQTPLTESR